MCGGDGWRGPTIGDALRILGGSGRTGDDGRRAALQPAPFVVFEYSPEPQRTAPLSPREQEVAELATSGATSKEIAYHLGLAHSTVRVLLARAAAKLGALTRAELIERMTTEAGLDATS